MDLPTSSLGISISEFPNLSFIMSAPHLSRLRVQKYCCKTYSPNVFTTFLQLFFTLLDCQGFINALFSPLGSGSFFSLSLNCQFSKSWRVFTNSRRLFSNIRRLFFFYAYLLKTNKRESILILVGFTFDSRLVCFIIMIDLLKNV